MTYIYPIRFYYKRSHKRTNLYKRSNFYSNGVINDWNSLSQSVVGVNDFKTLLDRHYNDYLFNFVY